MSLKKAKTDTDYTERVEMTFEYLKYKFGYTARITRLYEMIQYALNIDEFEMFDSRILQTSKLESFLLEKCIDWQQGKVIDFGEIYDAMLINADFSSDEKLLFRLNDIEEIIWAIFLLLFSPDLKFNKK